MSQRGQYYNYNQNKQSRGKNKNKNKRYQDHNQQQYYQDHNQQQYYQDHNQQQHYQDHNQQQYYQDQNQQQYYQDQNQQQFYQDQNQQQYYQKHEYEQQKHKQYSHNKSSANNNDKNIMSIDGSMMEGGGQILRNCFAFSALLHKPIHVHSIRGKRNNPGLRKQHLKGIELISQINSGKLTGNYMKSTQITYYPTSKQSYNNNYSIDIETAGSVCLLIQTCLPLLIFSPLQCKLTIIGGTNASFAPQIDYFISVLQPMLNRLMNINVQCQVLQRGFYPKGGGKVVMITEPLKTCIPAFDLTKKGKIKSIYGTVIVEGRDLSCSGVGNAMISGAIRELKVNFGTNIAIKIDIISKTKNVSLSSGIAMTIIAETDTGCLFGGSSLGDYGVIANKRNKGRGRGSGSGSYSKRQYADEIDNNNINLYYEEVGCKAAKELINDWNISKFGCTDRWLQDQLIIFMALAKGKSRMKTSTLEMHTKTAIYIAEIMTGVKFVVLQQKDGSVLVECDGIGYKPQHFENKKIKNDDSKEKDIDGSGYNKQKKKKNSKSTRL
eukprot:551755_1